MQLGSSGLNEGQAGHSETEATMNAGPKWGDWSISAQIIDAPRIDFVRVPWLGIAVLFLGRLAINITWPVAFPDDGEQQPPASALAAMMALTE